MGEEMKALSNKFFSGFVLIALAPAMAFAANTVKVEVEATGLPVLHKIQAVELAAPYSCGGSYDSSALFLSRPSAEQNSPDLLFNGACGAEKYVHTVTALGDMGLVADLGAMPLEKVNVARSFNPLGLVGGDSLFRAEMPLQAGHTYAVLVAKGWIRALYAFSVESMSPDRMHDGGLKIRVAVLQYSFQRPLIESSGWDWEAESR